MSKGCIFYSDGRVAEPIKTLAWKSVVASGLEITTSYLQPNEKRSYPQMIKQIISCLERSSADYVFFLESDVLYHKSHFDFNPSRLDTFYYNTSNVRWDYPHDRAISYDGLTSLSQLCVGRELALSHYKLRQNRIMEMGEGDKRGEPRYARKWGYEPGTKSRRNGALREELSERWASEYPNVDIRHGLNFSKPKTTLESFKHKPTGWLEFTLKEIPGWDLKTLFNL